MVVIAPSTTGIKRHQTPYWQNKKTVIWGYGGGDVMTNKKKPSRCAQHRNGIQNNVQNEVYNIPLHLAISAFRDFLIGEGFGRIDIVADGRIHRFRVAGQKKGTANGYYGFFADGFPAGFVGDYKNDRYLTWHYKTDKPLNPKQQAEIKQAMQKARAERKAEQIKRYAKGRRMANSIWNRGTPALANHPYLVKKHCQGLASYCRQDRKGNLLIPLFQHKRLVGIQYINQHGGKFFAKNIELKGAYFVIGDMKKPFDVVYVAEGVSSGYAVHILSNKSPVFCAMNASNLKAVACAIRDKWADIKIIIACDNDVRADDTAINIGVVSGEKAAIACGGVVSIPHIPNGKKCDWNDLYCQALTAEGASHE